MVDVLSPETGDCYKWDPELFERLSRECLDRSGWRNAEELASQGWSDTDVVKLAHHGVRADTAARWKHLKVPVDVVMWMATSLNLPDSEMVEAASDVRNSGFQNVTDIWLYRGMLESKYRRHVAEKIMAAYVCPFVMCRFDASHTDLVAAVERVTVRELRSVLQLIEHEGFISFVWGESDRSNGWTAEGVTAMFDLLS